MYVYIYIYYNMVIREILDFKKDENQCYTSIIATF